MKMLSAGTAAPNQYTSYVANCLRSAACEPAYSAPLPSVSALQLYVDFGAIEPTDIEFTFIDTCNNDTEQITPGEFIIGQTPEGNWYGVFRTFNNPAATYTAFVVHLSVNDGAQTFFSQMFSTQPCGPLMKIKSCHPEGATTTGFDINGIYYGLPVGGFTGTEIRYWHIAYVRDGKVRELNDKATFKSNLYSNFRTTIEKVHLLQTELTPKWYKNVLLAIYSRGVVSVDDGQAYIVSDLAFEALNDDDLIWKPYAQLKETFRLFYGCDDAVCESCCNPTLLNVTINEGPVESESPGESEPPPPSGCLRVIFGITGSDGQPWAIGGTMCDGHPLSMEAIVGDGIAPLPLCVQFDSLTGINPPVSILFTEPCPNDCVVYRNPSLTENTTGITYRDCAGVWHEDITLGPGEEICARRSWVIGPTTGVAGPGSGTLEEVGFCGSFPDESESEGGSVSGSEPGGGSEPGAECCDPTVLTSGTETTIPDGSLPGGESESVAPTCCTPVVLNACIETIPDDSGSGSGSESEPELGLRLRFDSGAYGTYEAMDLSDWNTLFNTVAAADTPFTSMVQSPGTNEITLLGCTNLELQNIFEDNIDITGFFDDGGVCTGSTGATFLNCLLLTDVELNFTTIFGAQTFNGSGLVNFSGTIGTSFSDSCFANLSALQNISLPAATIIGNSCFHLCSNLVSIDLPVAVTINGFAFRAISGPGLIEINSPVCAPYGGTAGNDFVFFETAGQDIEITLPSSETTDGDIVAVSGSNTVTLIPV